MKKHAPVVTLLAAMLMMTAIGCDQNENRRLADMAEKNLQRQAEQNRQLTELQRQVAEGSRRLVEADAKARTEMAVLQREVQAERAEMGRQRDVLEDERRDLAAKRRMAPIIAAAITNIGLLLACVLPLVLCLYLLHQRVEPADDQAIAEVFLDDLVANRPVLLPQVEPHRAIGSRNGGDSGRLANDSDQTDGST